MPLLKRNPASRGYYSAQASVLKNECENSCVSDAADDRLADLTLEDITGGDETVEDMIAVLDAMGTADFDLLGKSEPVEAEKPLTSAPTVDLPECQNGQGIVAILGKANRYVSPFRDAQFLRNLKALFNGATPAPAGNTLSVSHTAISPSHSLVLSPSLSPSTSTSPSASSPSEATQSLLNHTKASNPKSREKPWWDRLGGGVPLPAPARQYRSAAPWRDTSDELQITYRHLALRTLGPVHAFTLNLSPEVEALARKQRSPKTWLHKRIAHHLKKALGRDVEFHLVLEEAEGHRLHIHGEVQVAAEEAREARTALRKAGGRWDGAAPQKQARTDPEPDRGWVDYMVKDLWRIRHTRGLLQRLRIEGATPSSITFSGEPTASTAALSALAKSLYEQHRQQIKQQPPQK